MLFLKQFCVASISFLVLDFLWLGFVVKSFNLRQLAEIGRIENGDFRIHYAPAILVYLLMALAVVFFVLPKIEGKSLLEGFFWGAMMGFLIYGVYDLTNLAILKNYPIPFAVADMAWGTTAFGITATLTKYLSY